jgi:hypothetical protein
MTPARAWRWTFDFSPTNYGHVRSAAADTTLIENRSELVDHLRSGAKPRAQ